MKKHKDLVVFLNSKGLRATPAKKILLQFFLDNEGQNISLSAIHKFVGRALPETDRTTIYRILEKFIELGIVQRLKLTDKKTVYQYIFDKKVHHYFICKRCGTLSKGNRELFERIERALKDVHGFFTANISAVFYGVCRGCDRATS